MKQDRSKPHKTEKRGSHPVTPLVVPPHPSGTHKGKFSVGRYSTGASRNPQSGYPRKCFRAQRATAGDIPPGTPQPTKFAAVQSAGHTNTYPLSAPPERKFKGSAQFYWHSASPAILKEKPKGTPNSFGTHDTPSRIGRCPHQPKATPVTPAALRISGASGNRAFIGRHGDQASPPPGKGTRIGSSKDPGRGVPARERTTGTLHIRTQTKRLTQLALLGALALAISGLELILPPLPMLPPGAKPGLSNIVTMYAAGSVGLLPALGIALIKGVFAGFTRGLIAFLMSTLGGLLSTLLMGLLLKCKAKPFGLVGVGIVGAVTHNAAQLGVALLLTTPAVVAYVPFLLIFSVLTGSVTGLILRGVLPALKRLG